MITCTSKGSNSNTRTILLRKSFRKVEIFPLAISAILHTFSKTQPQLFFFLFYFFALQLLRTFAAVPIREIQAIACSTHSVTSPSTKTRPFLVTQRARSRRVIKVQSHLPLGSQLSFLFLSLRARHRLRCKPLKSSVRSHVQ